MRLVLLALVFLIIAAVPARAQEKLCLGQSKPAPPPTKEQKEQADLESWAQQRAEFGFRHDIPYVKELVKRGVWEYDVGYIPVTPAENRYLKLRDELELGARAERYLRAHRDVDGGVSVEDNWPHEPYLLLHLTRGVSKHLAAIRALAKYPHPASPRAVYRFTRHARSHLATLRKRSKFPDAIRVENTSVTTDQLDALNKRIAEDAQAVDRFFDGYGRVGLYLVGLWRDELTTRVELQVITPRPDAVAYFTSRYGPLVHVSVIGDRFECATSYAPRGLSRPL
jgi:hypothetical protein